MLESSQQCPMAELVTASDCYRQIHRKVVSSSLTGAVGDFNHILSRIYRVPVCLITFSSFRINCTLRFTR